METKGHSTRAPSRSIRLTTRGWLMMATASATTILAIAVGSTELLIFSVAVLALVALTFALQFFLPTPRLTDVNIVPQPVQAANPLRLTASATRWGDWLFTAQFDPRLAPEFVLPPGGIQIVPRARGVFQGLKIRAIRRDIFNFSHTQLRWDSTKTITVVPRTVPLELGKNWHRGGTEGTRIRSEELDDATVRTYVPGDELRRVHWKATARHGELLVRREEVAGPNTLQILIDNIDDIDHIDDIDNQAPTAHTHGVEHDQLFEEIISAAASLTCAAIAQNWRVVLSPTRGVENALPQVFTHSAPALETLALLQSSRQVQPEFNTVRDTHSELTIALLRSPSLTAVQEMPKGSAADTVFLFHPHDQPSAPQDLSVIRVANLKEFAISWMNLSGSRQ